jgi:hypothetical protein
MGGSAAKQACGAANAARLELGAPEIGDAATSRHEAGGHTKETSIEAGPTTTPTFGGLLVGSGQYSQVGGAVCVHLTFSSIAAHQRRSNHNLRSQLGRPALTCLLKSRRPPCR